MKNIELKNILKLCSFNLYTTRKTIIGWCVAIFSLMTLYMILFPSIQDMAQLKMEAMPKELLQFVGMEDMTDLGNFSTYFSMIYGIILIAISIFSATFSAGLIAKEEKTGSIEFLNSLAVSKTEIYLSKFLTSIVAVGAVLTCAIVATITCGFINGGDTFDAMDIISAAKVTSFTALFFGGTAFLLAGVSAKFATGAFAAGIVLVSYMLGYLGELLGEDAEFLLKLSPFISFNAQNTVDMSDEVVLTLAAYILVYLVAIVIGAMAYRRRDLKI